MPSIELKSFHIKNYKGIIDTKVENIPSGTQWIFLTGENGFGKTSVLQGITLVSREKMYNSFIESSEKKMEVEIEVNYYNKSYRLESTIRNKVVIEKKRDNKLDLSNYLIAYGSSRLRVSAGTTKEVANKYSSTDSLFSNEILLADIEEYFKDWIMNYPDGFKRLQKIFRTLIPKLSKIGVEFNVKEKKTEVLYYENDLEGNAFEQGLLFNQLAAGYKNIIATIGDMIIRLSLIQSFEIFKELSGIVLIDEFELHLHPKYQKLFVEKLTELFPKIQFIVSTHSPIPLLGAPANSVIINVTRTKEEGIQAKLLDIDFSVLTPNTILSSPIFGFQDLIPDSKSNDKMIRTEDTFAEVEFNDQLKSNINKFLTKERQEELLKLIKTP